MLVVGGLYSLIVLIIGIFRKKPVQTTAAEVVAQHTEDLKIKKMEDRCFAARLADFAEHTPACLGRALIHAEKLFLCDHHNLHCFIGSLRPAPDPAHPNETSKDEEYPQADRFPNLLTNCNDRIDHILPVLSVLESVIFLLT